MPCANRALARGHPPPCRPAGAGAVSGPMMRALPFLQALGLALLLVVTGQALAVARGAPLPAGQVELCTGSGPVMVLLDSHGQPIDAPHYCPEGVLALLLAVALPMPDPRPSPVSRRLDAPVPAPGRPLGLAPAPRARAPPLAA